MNKYIFLTYCLPIVLFSNNFQFSGELWYDYSNNEDHTYSSIVGYIPKFTYKINKANSHNFDIQYSAKLLYDITNTFREDGSYRSFIKYSYNDNFSARLGLQKISFGNSLILRPLNWFDTLDYRTATDHTLGVEALKINYFYNDYEFLFWSMMDDYKSYGMRLKRYLNRGIFGITLFNDKDNSNHSIYNTIELIDSQPEPEFPGSNYRIGVDYRYDNIIGLWIEGNTITTSLKDLSINRLDLLTIGIDYTLPVYNGVLLLSETMHSAIVSEDINILNQTMSAFMVSVPIGMFNDISLISLYEWDRSDSFNLIRWTTTFDYFKMSVNYSVNPDQIGDTAQLMFIYNH